MKNFLRNFIRSYIFIAALLASLSAFSQTYASNIKPPDIIKKAKINKEQTISLEQLLKQFEGKYDVRFDYATKAIANIYLNSKSVNNSSGGLEQRLATIFGPLGLTYEKIHDHIYQIYPKVVVANENTISRNEFADLSEAPKDKAVTGKVVDETGKGLPGASVSIKGTGAGITTDASGNYRINVPDNNTILVFSFIGYDNQEIQVGNRNVINVTLVSNIQNLSSVVVVGYGTQKRADLTGSVASVSGKKLENLPVTDVTSALQGRMAGVEIVRSSTEPGSDAQITIRGVSSLRNRAPLYIIDGVRQGGAGNFNMQDIESIDVLKDASAAAIYGAAASGGVIIITTKKGLKNSVPRVNLSGRYGIVKPLLNHFLDRDEFVRLQRLKNPDYLANTDINTLPNTDWIDELYKQGSEQNYNLSLSGATEKTNYFVSGFYNREDGIFIDNSNQLYGARVNTDYKLGKRIKFGEQMYVYQQDNNPISDNNNNAFYRTTPLMPVYDPNNPIGGFGKAPAGFGGSNPVGIELSEINQNKNLSFQGNVYGEIDLPFHLKLRTTLGYSLGESNNNLFTKRYDFGPVSNVQNSLRKEFSSSRSFLHNSTLTYEQSFGGAHNLKALIGYEQIKSRSNNINATQLDLALEPTFAFFPTSTSTAIVGGGFDDNGLIKSQFARINYDYNGRYLLTASVRRDANFLKFGPGNQYGIFPAGSVGWRISDENFFKPLLNTVNNLKLRGSYGVLGNDNIPSYIFLSTYEQVRAGTFAPGGARYIGISQSGLPNRDIKWESVYEGNIGLDAEALASKLYITVEWYNKTTRDMLYNLPIPSSAGFQDNLFINIGSVRNRGVEFVTGYRSQVKGVNFDISFNGAFNKNIVLNLDNINENPINAGTNGYNYGPMSRQRINRTQAGIPFAQFYGFKANGIYQTDEEAAKEPQFSGTTARAGDLRFEDITGDGMLTDDDRTFIGDPNPKFVYGASINLNFKGFDVQALFNGVSGVDIFNGVAPYSNYLFGDGNTTSKVFGASFLGNNGLTAQPRIGVLITDPGGQTSYIDDRNGNYRKVNSFFVENGSYLKLKNLQIGYTLPKSVLSRLRISDIRIFIMGYNLLTFTKYSGLDPEIGGGVTDRGIDSPLNYPNGRIYSIGLSVGF